MPLTTALLAHQDHRGKMAWMAFPAALELPVHRASLVHSHQCQCHLTTAVDSAQPAHVVSQDHPAHLDSLEPQAPQVHGADQEILAVRGLEAPLELRARLVIQARSAPLGSLAARVLPVTRVPQDQRALQDSVDQKDHGATAVEMEGLGHRVSRDHGVLPARKAGLAVWDQLDHADQRALQEKMPSIVPA